MKTRIALGALLLSALSLPAMAAAPFQAEIDCGGVVTPPAAVPYTLSFENQTLQTQTIDVTVRLTFPSGQTIKLRDASINLGPNQDRTLNLNLNLRDSAPAGSYTMIIVATSPTSATFDTCSFNVN